MENAATLFKALAEPIRLRILALLKDGELCVCDLTETLALPQSTVSRHLAVLRTAGWIRGRKGGSWTYYSLAREPGAAGAALLDPLLGLLAATPEAARDREALAERLRAKEDGRCA
ncbi:transcriptional regulator, ArsR family [Alkalidesulfovibrio alkalitolerans DSM 16529]|jgi:ArsR family transcriptional regulator|uniref:Transcriptional regulator, ArsR family n=1 Tax=Alkalidesulfovibrio alkalitolerans DSM 16529 TaxID=1121439 RepID=S7UJ59_9BACT|nr:metalloregulator ArsR/SmtB family transcription factor [Alkalidesulfovibrio alkalitolerans]EPR32323.1 transcriptional regulator, ArsR family [Alkalidesulfovibrio alkalitolerans DSM 16529]